PGGGQLDVGDAFDFVGASAFSVELWATPALTSSFQNVAEKRAFDGGAADGWVLYFNSVDGGMAEVQFEQPAWGAADQRVAWSEIDGAARPLHVVVTYDSSQGIRLYVNDVRTANAFDADGGPIANGIALTLLGGYTGMLDELAIYDHALSQDRVAAHFHAAGR
ncbi:MAG TPA: LamG-like jellyroll fold domain-containing protein, partial [Labilithrix sp.]